MPRPCAVEAHVFLLKLKRQLPKALSVSLHGASPWHLRESCSCERESPRGEPVASRFEWYDLNTNSTEWMREGHRLKSVLLASVYAASIVFSL
jgi:hypothetical protein